MKRFLSFFLALMLMCSLCACDLLNNTTSPDPSTDTVITTPSTDETVVPDLNAEAVAKLEELVANHLCDENFISVIVDHVPDLFMLQEAKAIACWTYRLTMSDGIEYHIITDQNGTITSISYWNDGDTSGPQLYPAE